MQNGREGKHCWQHRRMLLALRRRRQPLAHSRCIRPSIVTRIVPSHFRWLNMLSSLRPAPAAVAGCSAPRGRRGALVVRASSGGQDADEQPLPEVPKQRRRSRRKEKPAEQPFTIDTLNPVTSEWGCPIIHLLSRGAECGWLCGGRPAASACLSPAVSAVGCRAPCAPAQLGCCSGPQVSRGV